MIADPVSDFSQIPNTYKDIEAGGEEIHARLRLGFIRKVYGILTAQLALTVLLSALTFVQPVREFYKGNIAIFWVCLALSIFIICPLICCRSIARKSPLNYIFLSVWTFCEAYMIATLCSFYSPRIVITAASLTAGVVFALTLYAFTTKTDFTYYGGFLFVATALLLLFGLFSFLFGEVVNTIYCVLGVLLFSVYLIYDTQLVMGKFGNEYEIDDYIIAALMIYLDIIQIFLYLLELLGRGDRN